MITWETAQRLSRLTNELGALVNQVENEMRWKPLTPMQMRFFEHVRDAGRELSVAKMIQPPVKTQ